MDSTLELPTRVVDRAEPAFRTWNVADEAVLAVKYYDFTVDDSKLWTEVSNSFVPMEQKYREPERWHATLVAQETAAYNMLHWNQRGERISYRTPSNVRKVPLDEIYWIVLPERGPFSLRYGDDTIRVMPGGFMMMRFDEVVQIHMPSSVSYAFQVPRVEIDHRVEPCVAPARVHDLNSGLGRVVWDMIRRVHAERSNLSDREFNAVCERISELLCMLAVGDMHPQQAHLSETVEAIRRYVRENVGVGDLRLPAVARALGWSPRKLRSVLRQSGTTYRDVRQDETLRAARDLLANPGRDAMSIRQVAVSSGFAPTWFASAFKARYGETPGEFRRRRLAELADQPVPRIGARQEFEHRP
ncbi:helix-turn-helix transcriptional regulator [Nocardia sp. NPDC051787]|uniref:helix-turn-helix transcriptional regulator n=1 Tax=Nocardia sp. NPDC051787 TaxID=3155415 RepID=UPI003420EA76